MASYKRSADDLFIFLGNPHLDRNPHHFHMSVQINEIQVCVCVCFRLPARDFQDLFPTSISARIVEHVDYTACALSLPRHVIRFYLNLSFNCM